MDQIFLKESNGSKRKEFSSKRRNFGRY